VCGTWFVSPIFLIFFISLLAVPPPSAASCLPSVLDHRLVQRPRRRERAKGDSKLKREQEREQETI
jgi:hypothetical protein